MDLILTIYAGHLRQIPHVWTYMLLGQVVAISFASNLFFLAVLLSPAQKNSEAKAASHQKDSKITSWVPLLVTQLAVVLITLINVGLIPSVYGTPSYLPVLAAPHILLIVLPLLPNLPFWSPEKIYQSSEDASWHYSTLYNYIIFCSFVLQVITTQNAFNSEQGLYGIVDALYEHPAVSSVGWDVILCWLSFGLWVLLKE